MKNYEKWLNDLVGTTNDMPFQCVECPARTECAADETTENCAEFFRIWSERETENG